MAALTAPAAAIAPENPSPAIFVATTRWSGEMSEEERVGRHVAVYSGHPVVQAVTDEAVEL